MSTNKTILITGCSSGIGHSTALLFAEKNWNVVATMRNPENAGALANLPNVKVVALDVTDTAAIDAAVKIAVSTFGTIDVLVNNAGYGLFGPFETATQVHIDKQFQTNVYGVFNVTRAVLPVMRAQKSGMIINIASIGGLTTFPMNSLYHATKFAIVGFTESLAYELAPLGISAKVVAPGGVATDFAGRSLALTFDMPLTPDNPYADTIGKVMTAFSNRTGNRSTAEMLAEAIFETANDASGQVIYVVGKDAEATYAARKAMPWDQFSALTRQNMGLAE